jgi:hypothetical protein
MSFVSATYEASHIWYLLRVSAFLMIRPVIRYLATLGGVGLLAGLGALASPLVWPADPDASLVIRNGHLVGEVVGYVWHADPGTATIEVSASPVGLRAIPVQVNADTRITEGAKEGAFGDLTKHTRVRLIYEAQATGRMASSIELLRQGSIVSSATRVDSSPRTEADYWVEVGIFTDLDAAAALATRLLEHNLTVSIESAVVPDHPHPVLRVQIGPFADEAAARAAQRNLRAGGYQARALW